MTTLITLSEWYQYCCTPVRNFSAFDDCIMRFDDTMDDFPRMHKCIDHVSSVEAAFCHTYDFLEFCARRGITLKCERFRICRLEVQFLPRMVGVKGVMPAHYHRCKPTITDVRSWLINWGHSLPLHP